MKTELHKPVNVSKAASFVYDLKISWRAFVLMLKQEHRAARRAKGLIPGDAFFNFVKMSFLKFTLLRYRRSVRFDGQVILDSTFPPYPSRALDKRLYNYINNLDLKELPTGIVSISTTNCCPYSCAFCSTDARKDTDGDLDEELLKRTISQVESVGVPTIILHGGEPMYRYDRFLRLVKHINNDTCLWMFTTGYGVTPERARELKENGLFGVWVSLDHFQPEVHNRLRGNPEAFENACKAVESFKQAGVYTCLSLVPPPDLLEPENFIKYYDFARDLGVAEIRVMEKKPSGREACRGVVPHSSALENLQKELFKDPAYRDYPPFSGLSTWLEKDPALGCQCRFEYLYITATGEVQPCEAAEVSFGNIRDEEFLELYGRACRAFANPATGCIPMVMYDEVRKFQSTKDQMSSIEKSARTTGIIADFQARGGIPGAYRPIWAMYQRRLQAYRRRKTAKAEQGG